MYGVVEKKCCIVPFNVTIIIIIIRLFTVMILLLHQYVLPRQFPLCLVILTVTVQVRGKAPLIPDLAVPNQDPSSEIRMLINVDLY